MDSLRLRTLLDTYYQQVEAVILRKQHPVSGLLPASTAVTTHGNYRDAWVRDNVYSILAVWGLGLAYRQLDDDGGRAHELQHRTINLMRGLLRSMMAQTAKVEAFKHSRLPHDALHAKYDTETGGVVVGDTQWGHLQIDATSIFLLMLTQMIGSGLDIIWTMPEVNFVQNLVYYIERAYRTPDYGIWERGAKSNQGSVELNASSIGMAKAALEALSGFDLFGAKGSQRSVVHVAPDNIAQSNITLTSLLPRESNTKEIDAALLSIISYPAFAVSDLALVERVRSDIVEKLQGRYGLKRFLRDGHQTVLEDEGRLHYEQLELKQFEHIESEWPLFYTYLYLDAIFRRDEPAIQDYEARLASVTVEQDGLALLPELYYVPAGSIEAEKAQPHTQERLPNANVPLVWAQSLYLLGRMLRDGVLRPGDIDPLGRRRLKLPRRPVVQLVFLAEDDELQAELAAHGVSTQTPSDIAPITVYLPDHIARAHGQIGRNDQMGLTGRSARALKSLTTSRFYQLGGKTVVCLASFFMEQEFFLAYDIEFVIRRFQSELQYLHQNWTALGRPTVTVLLTRNLLGADRTAFYAFMRQVASGTVAGVPVKRGTLSELMTTASFERIDELHDMVLPKAPLRELARRGTALAQPELQIPLNSSARDGLSLELTAAALTLRLEQTANLYEQIELLALLLRQLPLQATVLFRGVTRSLVDVLQEVYEQAGRLRLWAVVRRAAGLLGKVDGDLSLAVGAILVRQMNIQIGRLYAEDAMITQPIPEHELLAKIRTYCPNDIRDQVLTQELLLYLSLLIKAQPELFLGLLTVRVSHLISLLVTQLSAEFAVSQADAYEQLMHQPPSLIQRRLEQVVASPVAASVPPRRASRPARAKADVGWAQDLGFELIPAPKDGWLEWRQHNGTIDRRTTTFYAAVWNIAHYTPAIVVGRRGGTRGRMDSSIVASDTTPGEAAFALWLEQLLNQIDAAEYRQLTVEALAVAASFFLQNRSVRLRDELDIDVLLERAARLSSRPTGAALAEVSPAPEDTWASFYAKEPASTAKAVADVLRSMVEPAPG